MVSDIAGTTRDAIDTLFTVNGTQYNIIDTAGIRRKRAVEDETLERYSVLRSIAAIRRCDVALLLIDAQDGVTEQDTKIAGLIRDEGKAVIIIVNKWDAVEKETGTLEQFRKEVLDALKFMDYAPVLFLSAKTGQRVHTVIDMVDQVWAQTSKRIPTGVLNDVLNDATADLQPPATNGRRLKIYYITQQSACPPTFILFVNEEALMHFAYQRYLENYFRKTFDFTGTPIRFILREKDEGGKVTDGYIGISGDCGYCISAGVDFDGDARFKAMGGPDLHKVGSGNTGATNALRTMGKKGGAIVFAGDVVKALLACLVGRLWMGQNGALLAGLFVILGHNWPVFFGFKGRQGRQQHMRRDADDFLVAGADLLRHHHCADCHHEVRLPRLAGAGGAVRHPRHRDELGKLAGDCVGLGDCGAVHLSSSREHRAADSRHGTQDWSKGIT